MNDRAISDLVGFTLMFSIIIMSVAIVSTAGITQLSELSERESINSAERGMEAFAGSADDLVRQGDIVRGATLAPSGGLVWFNGSTELKVTVDRPSPTLSTAHDISLNATEHRFSRNPEDVSVVYEGGAVMRSDGGGAIVRPQWRCADDRAVLTAVKLVPGDGLADGSGFGSGTSDVSPTSGDEIIRGDIESTDSGVQFQMRRTNTEVETYSDDDGRLTVTIDPADTANPAQWRFYFDRSDQWTDVGSGDFACQDVGHAVVRTVTVELSV